MTITTCDNSQWDSVNKRNDSNYALIIEEINNILFWVKRCPIPSISLVDDQEMSYEGVPYAIEGNTFNYGSPMEISFFLDEKMYVHNYLYQWVKGFQMGTDYEGTKQKQASLLLFDNNGQQVQSIFNFKDMYCREIAQIENNNIGSEQQEVSATFTFDLWTPEYRNSI